MISLSEVARIADERGFEVTWCSEYAEPGYDCGKNGIVFANWNNADWYNPETREREEINKDAERFCDIFEKLRCEIEWSDEWTVCDECGGAVRVSGDCYHWKSFYAIVDGDILCANCIKEDPESYFWTIEGNTRAASTFDIDPEDYGYILFAQGYENGFHDGMTDNPETIAESLISLGLDRFIFRVTETSQFYITFSVYVRADDVCGDYA